MLWIIFNHLASTLSEAINEGNRVIDQLESDCTDPRQEFNHNFLTEADRRRAEIRRQLQFPGIYESDPIIDMADLRPSTSGLQTGAKPSTSTTTINAETEMDHSNSKVPETPRNENNSNNHDASDNYHYDDDYRKTSTMKKSRSTQSVSKKTTKSKDKGSEAESETVSTSTATVNRVTGLQQVPIPSPETFQKMKKKLKKGRKRWTYQQLMDSSFRSDNAQGISLG